MIIKKPVKTRRRLIYRSAQFLIRSGIRILFGARYSYESVTPFDCPLIVASNHVSYFDPPVVGSGLPRELYFLAKRELFRNALFGGLIKFFNSVPIRRGIMDWTAIATLKDILAHGGAVFLFPEGTRSRDEVLGKPKFGVGMLAQETRAVIIPVYVRGTGRLWEAFMRRRPMRIFYGNPIHPDEYADLELSPRGQVKIAEMVMERIAALKRASEEPPA